MNDQMRRKWFDLLQAWAVDLPSASRTFDEICRRYAEPGRFYHTLAHVGTVLEVVESLGSHARNLKAITLAAWLHDVVYDSRAPDNELRSAEYAEQMCQALGIPDRQPVASLILKTKRHDAGGEADAEVLLDADLAVLGAGESTYREYAAQIRQEYAWVPEPEYRTGRRQVLERFLARPRIFHFLSPLEDPARRNIAAEIAALTQVEGT